MKQPSKERSSEKENRRAHSKKRNKDLPVREGEGDNSIFNEANDKRDYPYPHVEDKQFDNQPEFIDRNSDKKDKT